jgi:CPA1 family monovalent cation:H+ antiporter
MTAALTLLAIGATVLVVSGVARRLGILTPLLLMGAGVLASFLPFVPELTLSPEVVLYGLLPPLLYATAIGTSLIDLKAHRVAIAGLSVGLVLFTAAGVGLVSWLMLPVPFAVAFALGAVVAPPDAVAATAVARRSSLPRRVVTILEGESLLNDATALVALGTAITASGLSADGGHVTPWGVALEFVWAATAGVGIGWCVYAVLGATRRGITDPVADTAVSFLAPFAAYLPAELVHASGVLAVVTTGLLLGHRAPVLQSAASRLSERSNWASIQFLLENAVFLLIGLQAARLVRDVRAGDLSLGRAVVVSVVVLVAVLVLRPLWVVSFRWAQNRLGPQEHRVGLRYAVVAGWAGMRGVVTLAAALLLPLATPQRPVLVLTAMVVVVGTLLLQGTTLPALARALRVLGPDPRADALQEATVLQAAVSAGLRAVEQDEGLDPAVLAELRDKAALRVNRVWERLGTLGPGAGDTPSETYRRVRLRALTAERQELLRIRDSGTVDQEVLGTVLGALDVEESTLGWALARTEAVRAVPLRPPPAVTGECDHLRDSPDCTVPASTQGCPDCRRLGLTWVHLRVCLGCGNVGCCDSSVGKHAAAHFHDTQHPVMRSLEPGEAWRWCYVDEVLG